MKGFPDDRDAIARRPSMSQQLADTMFAPLPTPSGPQTPARTRAMNSFNAYCAWKRSEEGGKAFGWMLTRAREKLTEGETRIGMKALAESCRATLRVQINNSFVSWAGDDIVAADARLLPLIERRQRRSTR